MATTLDRLGIVKRLPINGIGAEIGVWQGDFSAMLLEIASPKELHLVDPWEFVGQFPMRWYGGRIAKTQRDMDDIYAGVSARFSSDVRVKIRRLRSIDAAGNFPDGYFDWVYIDGDHSYSAATNDLFAWSTKVKPGGILCGDDLYWRDESHHLSVSSAVADFARETNRSYEIIVPDQFKFVM
jgi:hypothetical protein